LIENKYAWRLFTKNLAAFGEKKPGFRPGGNAKRKFLFAIGGFAPPGENSPALL